MNPEKIRQIMYAPADDTGAAGGDTNGTLTQAKQSVTSTAKEAASRVKSMASDTANRAKSEAQRIVADTKQQTASRIGGYSSAMHESAKNFEQQDPNIAWATHRMADRIQGVADYVREADFDDMRMDLENFARRHPVAFFGGLLVGGLVVGNLLKAHPPAVDDMDEDWEEGNESGSVTMSDPSAAASI